MAEKVRAVAYLVKIVNINAGTGLKNRAMKVVLNMTDALKFIALADSDNLYKQKLILHVLSFILTKSGFMTSCHL